MDTSNRFGPQGLSDWFWAVIQRADKNPAKLHDSLTRLSTDEVYRFALEFMLAASYVRGEPFAKHLDYRSEDHVDDMSFWVVSQGQEFYLEVCDHPESVAVYTGNDEQNRESLAGVAEHVLDNRVDFDVWSALNDDLIKYFESNYNRISDYWEEQQAQKR